MAQKSSGLLDRLFFQGSLRRWSREAGTARDMRLEDLRTVRGRARQLRGYLDHFIYEADSRLTLPLIGSNVMRRAPGSDWTWRPRIMAWTLGTCWHVVGA